MRKRWRDCLVFKKPSFITHSIFIIHHSITNHLSLKKSQFSKVACWALVSNFDNSKNFTFSETYKLTWCSFYFLFYLFIFFPSTPNTQTHRTQWKGIKKKKKKKTTPCERKKEEEEEEEEEDQPDLTTYGSLKYVCI